MRIATALAITAFVQAYVHGVLAVLAVMLYGKAATALCTFFTVAAIVLLIALLISADHISDYPQRNVAVKDLFSRRRS